MIKKLISNIKEVTLKVIVDNIAYCTDGVIYSKPNGYNQTNCKYMNFSRDNENLYLNLNIAKAEIDETKIVLNETVYAQFVYNLKSKKMIVNNQSLVEILHGLNKKYNSFFEDTTVVRKFVFDILKNEPFYLDLMQHIDIDRIDNFYQNILKIYLSDNAYILNFFTKFELYDSLNRLFSIDDESPMLNNVNILNENYIYKFCTLLNQYKLDCLDAILYASNNLDKNEIALLYKFTEVYFKIKKAFNDTSYNNLNNILNQLIDIKLIASDFTSVLNTLFKDIFKKYNIENFTKTITYYRDYLFMLDEIEDVKSTRFPKNIKSAHDRTLEKVNLIRDEQKMRYRNDANYNLAKNKAIQFKVATTKYKHLEYDNEKYKIMVPSKALDLIAEGDNLHHCVGGYINTVASGKSKILFCRKKDDISESYMTIEIRNQDIVQVKKNHDTYPNSEEQEFIAEFGLVKNLNVASY